jgi:hypothetical protein
MLHGPVLSVRLLGEGGRKFSWFLVGEGVPLLKSKESKQKARREKREGHKMKCSSGSVEWDLLSTKNTNVQMDRDPGSSKACGECPGNFFCGLDGQGRRRKRKKDMTSSKRVKRERARGRVVAVI